MTILQQLILEISQAITTYQDEKNQQGEAISAERQQNIVEIHQVLTTCQQPDSDKSAYRLRQRLIDYIDQMPKNILASLASIFDGSRLRQLLNIVLDKKEFSENELLAQENIELRIQQQMLGTAQNGDDLLAKLTLLTEELKQKTEQALLAMKRGDYYEETSTSLAVRCQESFNRNVELQKQYIELQDKNATLQTEISDFHIKVSQELDELKAKVREYEQLIEKLNAENRQLRLDRETERNRSFKIQKKLDTVTPQYAKSLEAISKLQSVLKAHGIPIPDIELQSFESKSDEQKSEPKPFFGSDSEFEGDSEMEFGCRAQ